MPQKSNHNFKEKYPYIRVGTLEPMRIKYISTNTAVFAAHQRGKNNQSCCYIITFFNNPTKIRILGVKVIRPI